MQISPDLDNKTVDQILEKFKKETERLQSSFENDVIKLKNSELDLYKNLEEYKYVKETSEKVW